MAAGTEDKRLLRYYRVRDELRRSRCMQSLPVCGNVHAGRPIIQFYCQFAAITRDTRGTTHPTASPSSLYNIFKASGLILFGLSDIFGTHKLSELSIVSLKLI